MSECHGELAEARRATPARGQQDAVSEQLLPAGQVKLETWIQLLHGHDATIRSQPNPRRTGGGEQAINDRLRGIRHRKHAAVALGFEADAAGREPVHRVAGGEFLQRADQLLPAARIAAGKCARLEARVRYVAATTARDADFGEALGGLFEDQHFRLRRGFGAGDGGENARRATTDDDYFLRTQGR